MRAASVVVAAAPARLGVGGVGGVGDVLCFNISHLTGVVVLPQHSPSQALTGALVSPVSVGAGVLAGAVPVVQQTLVDVQTVDGPTEPCLTLGRKGQFERQSDSQVFWKNENIGIIC